MRGAMNLIELDRGIDFRPGESVGDSITSPALAEQLSATSTDALLTIALLIVPTLILLFFWVIVRVPCKSGRRAIAGFRCPVSGRVVVAEFQFDTDNRQRIEVIWCSAFRPAVGPRCRKRCVTPAFTAPRRMREQETSSGCTG